MNANIKTVLLDFVSNPAITQSWGITDISVSDVQITFKVSAFKYIGQVTISDIGEFVKINLNNSNTEFATKPNLVLPSIDDMIESGVDYQSNLKHWIVEKIS